MAELSRKKVLALYKPNTGRGNFQPDVADRGYNRAVADVLALLGMNRGQIDTAFKKADEAAWKRSEETLRRVNARKVSHG